MAGDKLNERSVPDDGLAIEAAGAFESHLFGTPSRRRIMLLLHRSGSMTGRELAAELGVHVNTVHFHLRRLLDAGAVSAREGEKGELVWSATAGFVRDVVELDDAIAKIDITADDVVFLVGAGASVASGIPAVARLLPALWERGRHLGRRDLAQLEAWCYNHGIDNIEDMLTASYISDFATSKTHTYDLLRLFLFSRNLDDEHANVPDSIQDPANIRFLQETFQTLFGLLTSKMLQASPNAAHTAIASFAQRHSKSSIVTTNYDVCLDEALLDQGLQFQTSIGQESSPGAIPLIKIHGSVNWAYCESCHQEKQFDLREMQLLLKADKMSFAVTGICPSCDGIRRPLLVPPLSFKLIQFPALVDIWHAAKKRLEGAKLIVAVGYSFADADTYITRIIWQSLAKNENQHLLIVNPDPGIYTGIRERLSRQLRRFEERRVMYALGKAEDVMPSVVKALLRD